MTEIGKIMMKVPEVGVMVAVMRFRQRLQIMKGIVDATATRPMFTHEMEPEPKRLLLVPDLGFGRAPPLSFFGRDFIREFPRIQPGLFKLFLGLLCSSDLGVKHRAQALPALMAYRTADISFAAVVDWLRRWRVESSAERIDCLAWLTSSVVTGSMSDPAKLGIQHPQR